MRRRDDGLVFVEVLFALPVIFGLALACFGTMNALERRSTAQEIAQEASRAYVTAGSDVAGRAAALALGADIARNHGLEVGEFQLELNGTLRRGGQVTARVMVYVPLVPVARVGDVWLSATHTETTDPYRSM